MKLKLNIYSDQKFSNDTIEKLAENTKILNPFKMIVDGTYFTFNLAKKTISKGIELIPGQLVGRKQSESKMCYAETFKINQDNLVTECVNDQKPFYSNYDVKKEVCTAKFSKEIYSNCNLKKECRIKFQKKTNAVRGELRSKFYFGFKVLISNVKKLFNRPGIVTG